VTCQREAVAGFTETYLEIDMKNRNSSNHFAPALLLAATLGLVSIGSFAIAQPAKDTVKDIAKDIPKDPKAAGQPEMKLPPGWTMEDMQACIAAGTPGKMHEHLAKDVGIWQGKSTMWMAPNTEPMKSECKLTVTPMMAGRYYKGEVAGEMPGMGPYNGFGINGFDNVSQKFVSTWIDDQGTGIMTGTGELSADGKTLTWNYTFNCPIVKKPVVMRQIETWTSPTTKTLEMHGPDPKSGKEYKMMSIEFTKK
jgi:hypothetical protein